MTPGSTCSIHVIDDVNPIITSVRCTWRFHPRFDIAVVQRNLIGTACPWIKPPALVNRSGQCRQVDGDLVPLGRIDNQESIPRSVCCPADASTNTERALSLGMGVTGTAISFTASAHDPRLNSNSSKLCIGGILTICLITMRWRSRAWPV